MSLFDDTPDYMQGDEEEDEEVFLGSTLTRPTGAASSSSAAAAKVTQTASTVVGGAAGTAAAAMLADQKAKAVAAQAYLDAQKKQQAQQQASRLVAPKPKDAIDPRLMAASLSPRVGSQQPGGFVTSTPADVAEVLTGQYVEPMLPSQQGHPWLKYALGGVVLLGGGYAAYRFGPRLMGRR